MKKNSEPQANFSCKPRLKCPFCGCQDALETVFRQGFFRRYSCASCGASGKGHEALAALLRAMDAADQVPSEKP